MRTSTSSSTISTVSCTLAIAPSFSVAFIVFLQHPDARNDRAELVGLMQEGVGEADGAVWPSVAGGDDHLQAGLGAPHVGGELESVDRTWHPHVGDQDVGIG